MLVDQLKFARNEWLRAFDGVNDADGARRFAPMNSLGWMMGHLAWHENLCWNVRGQGINPVPELHDVVAYGKPASTPALSEMLAAWHKVAAAAEPYLASINHDKALTFWERNGKPHKESVGTSVMHVVYHYFYHIGEGQAVRQMLNHPNRPEFINDMLGAAAYR